MTFLKNKRAFLLVCVIVTVFLIGCDSYYGKIEKKEISADGSTLSFKYTTQDNGEAATARFILMELHSQAVWYAEVSTIRMNLFVESKNGDIIEMGEYEFDDLDWVRSFEGKTEFAKEPSKWKDLLRRDIASRFIRKTI